jgi:UDP-glucose 4-epimerase
VELEGGRFELKRKVLVTGAAGFIGSHVTEELLKQGHTVLALCKYSSSGSQGFLQELVDEKLRVVLGDIRDAELVRSLCSEVDAVVNLAALIGIPYSYTAPRSYLDTNLGGVLNLLEGIKNSNKKLVQISTSEVYGTPMTVPITLSHAINPQSPYAATKVAADALCLSYAHSFGTKVSILRPFNTYGPRQSLRAIIPTILYQIHSGSKRIKIGNLKAKRDFTYIDDTVLGITSAIDRLPGDGRIVQLGTGVTISIEELIHVCEELFNVKLNLEVEKPRIRPKGSEVDVLQSDPSSAKENLNWSARVNLRDGLTRTMEWISSEGRNDKSVTSYFV